MAASFSLSNVTKNSVTVTVIPDRNIPYYRIFCRLAAVESDVTFNASGVNIAAPTSFTISNLAPDTDYLVNVGTSLTGNQPWTWIGAQSFTTNAEGEVDDWDWTISNGSATAAQTQFAYTIFVSAGANVIERWDLKEISYLVWNDMVNKTYEVVADRNGEWNTDYGTIAETLMTATDKHMTARRFNAIVWNLAQYKTPSVTRKNQGDPMLGSYFIELANSINNTIYRG